MLGHQRYNTGQFYSNEDIYDEELCGVIGVMESLELDSLLQNEAVKHIYTQSSNICQNFISLVLNLFIILLSDLG